jgi:hypothetical protein
LGVGDGGGGQREGRGERVLKHKNSRKQRTGTVATC